MLCELQDNTLHTLYDITQRVSNYYTLYSKRPFFCVQSGKKLHRAEKFTQAPPVASVTNMRYELYSTKIYVDVVDGLWYVLEN